MHTRFPYFANGWADCVQIWCVAGDPLDRCFRHVWGGVHLRVRTCTPLFQISQTAGRIAFKFCVWLGAQYIRALHKSGWVASARAHVHSRFPYFANGWADCVWTWCSANDPLEEMLTQVRCGVHLHVRTCTLLSYDGASAPSRPSPINTSYLFYMLCWPLNLPWPGMEYCRPLVNIDQTPHHSSLYEYFSRHSRGSGSGSSPLRWRRKDIGEKILEEDLGVFNTLPKYTLAGTGGLMQPLLCFFWNIFFVYRSNVTIFSIAIPPIFFTSPWKLTKPWPPNLQTLTYDVFA